jgi:riboflavin biosynthesis pyrimidine reductase
MAHQVEICMITTPDGAIDIDGRSGPLGGPADQQRLATFRQHAAVVVVGAGTARAENYGPPSRPDLRIGVVTKSCRDDFSRPLYSSGAGFVITTTSSPDVPVDSLRSGVNEIDFRDVFSRLPDGIIHVEGGPMLNAALLDADIVDAINVTLSPHLVGVRGPGLSLAPHALRKFSLADVQHVDNFVFLRYEKK